MRQKKLASTAHIIFIEILVGIALSIGSLIIFADIANDIFQTEAQIIDTTISQFVYALRTPALNEVMVFITLLGAEFILFAAGLVTVLLAWKDHKREAVLFTVMLFVGFIVNSILKIIFQRPRPDFDPLMILNSYSFPSGHSMNAFIFYSILAYYVYHFTRSKWLSALATIAAILLILLVGFSRVYLGVHYPSDVLAGFIAGFFVFVTAIVLERTIAFRELVRKMKKK